MATHEWAWLTSAVFVQFAIERKVRFACSQCGNTWNASNFSPFTVNAGDDDYVPFVSSYVPGEGIVQTNLSRHIPAVRMTCTNCGHLEHFSMYVIREWWNKKAAEAVAKGPAQ